MTKETANSIKIVGSAIQPIYERAGDVVKSRYNQIRAVEVLLKCLTLMTQWKPYHSNTIQYPCRHQPKAVP